MGAPPKSETTEVCQEPCVRKQESESLEAGFRVLGWFLTHVALAPKSSPVFAPAHTCTTNLSAPQFLKDAQAKAVVPLLS